PETFEFKEALLNKKILNNPLMDVLKQNKRAVCRITLLCSLFGVAVYFFFVFVPNRISMLLPKSQTMLICSTGFLLTFFVSLLVGKYVDKIGANRFILIYACGFLVFSFPIFYLLSLPSSAAIIIGYGLFSILLGISAVSTMYVVLQAFP